MADEKPKAEYTVKGEGNEMTDIELTFGSRKSIALDVKEQLEKQGYTVKVTLVKEVL